MKKIILTALIFVFVAINIKAQEQDVKTSEQTNPNAPEITFEKLVYDYGTIKQGDDGSCEFKFTNTGKEPLVVSNVKSS